MKRPNRRLLLASLLATSAVVERLSASALGGPRAPRGAARATRDATTTATSGTTIVTTTTTSGTTIDHDDHDERQTTATSGTEVQGRRLAPPTRAPLAPARTARRCRGGALRARRVLRSAPVARRRLRHVLDGGRAPARRRLGRRARRGAHRAARGASTTPPTAPRRCPPSARLRAIADALAADPPPAARAVRVEVWETRFGPAFEPRFERLGAVQVEVPAPGGS